MRVQFGRRAVLVTEYKVTILECPLSREDVSFGLVCPSGHGTIFSGTQGTDGIVLSQLRQHLDTGKKDERGDTTLT